MAKFYYCPFCGNLESQSPGAACERKLCKSTEMALRVLPQLSVSEEIQRSTPFEGTKPDMEPPKIQRLFNKDEEPPKGEIYQKSFWSKKNEEFQREHPYSTHENFTTLEDTCVRCWKRPSLRTSSMCEECFVEALLEMLKSREYEERGLDRQSGHVWFELKPDSSKQGEYKCSVCLEWYTCHHVCRPKKMP